MDFVTNRLNKVLIGDEAIFVFIEPFEDNACLFFCQWEAPVRQKVAQLFLVDIRVIIFIKCLESFTDSLPLLADFGDKFFENVTLSD